MNTTTTTNTTTDTATQTRSLTNHKQPHNGRTPEWCDLTLLRSRGVSHDTHAHTMNHDTHNALPTDQLLDNGHSMRTNDNGTHNDQTCDGAAFKTDDAPTGDLTPHKSDDADDRVMITVDLGDGFERMVAIDVEDCWTFMADLERTLDEIAIANRSRGGEER